MYNTFPSEQNRQILQGFFPANHAAVPVDIRLLGETVYKGGR